MRTTVQKAKQITWVGLVINLLLAALKFGLGFLGRSQAVLADAVHSLSDMITDLFVLIGIRFWSAPADQCHPYGHQRIETIGTVAIASLLAFVALGIGWDAVLRMAHPVCPPLSFVVIAPLVSIFLKEILFHRTRKVGRSIHSPAVIANAWHHRSDAISSIPPLVAVVAATLNPKWAFLDPVGALIVSLLILKVAWDIASPAVAELTEKGADPREIEEIEVLARSVPGVHSIHRVRTRRLGAGTFVDLHVVVDGEISVYAGHEIANAVQYQLLEDGPAVSDVTVHIEPDEK